MSEKFKPGVGRIPDIDGNSLGEKPWISPAFNGAFVEDDPRELDSSDGEVWKRIPNPVGWRILVRPYLGSAISKGGILLPQEGATREALATVVGYVLKMGPLCYKDKRKFGEDAQPWCKEGDWVLIGKYAGARFRLYFDTGENPEVRMINDDEVIGKIIDPDDIRTL